MKIKKVLQSIFFVLLLLPSIAFSQVRQEVANIGDDNQQTIYGPSYGGTISLLSNYHFETLFMADEMNLTTDGELTAIEFYVTGGVDLGLLNDADVYLKTTSQSEVSEGAISNPGDEGYTQISGSFSLLGLSLDDGDILRFELDDGFEVEQGQNVALHTRSSIALGVSLGANFYASDANNLMRAGTTNAVLPPSNPTMEVQDVRPNARLEFESEFEVSPGNSVITAQQSEIFADGSSTTLVTLQVRTTTGENVNSGGDTVNFSTSEGSISSANDNGDGTYTATLISSDSPGTATITATLNGSSVGDEENVDFVDSLSQLYCTDVESDEIQIGNPTSTDTTPYGPLYNNVVSLTLGTYQFETIFRQNELGIDQAGFINSIDFFVTDDINVEALGNVQVYVKETSDGSLSDGDVSLDGYTFVGGNGALANITISSQDRLRVEFETPFYYSGNGNIAIHTRYAVLADVNVGGDFNYENANANRTKTSGDFINLLGITVGLTEPETTPNRPVVEFNFDFMTTPDLSESTLSADPTSIPANGSSTSTITSIIRQSDGSVCVLEAGTPVFETTAGTLGDVTDEGDGEYTIPLTSSTTPETATVQALLGDDYIDEDAEVEFFLEELPPSPEFTIIEASPGNIAADGSSTSEITVTLRDENDDPVTEGGFDIELSTTAGTLSDVTDNGDGTYTATLTSSTTPGTAEITGTLEGEDIDDTAEVEFTDLPPSPEFTTIEASPNTILADGSSTSEVTITLRDENDDPVTEGGFDVDLSSTAGTLSDVTDSGDGTYTATLTSSTSEETATISGTLEGEDIDDTAQVNFEAEVLPPSPDFTQITASPNTILADGSSTSEITVTLRDENDDPVTTGGFDVNLSTSAGTLSGITDNGDGTYTGTLTSSTNEETATISGTLEGEDIDDTAEVNFQAEVLGPSPEFTQISVEPDHLPADGESQATVTVTFYDENNSPVTEGEYCSLLNMSTTDGMLGDITDNGDGTCTLPITASNDPGLAEISGTLDSENIDDTADIEFTAPGPSPEFTQITASPVNILADGSSTSEITVTLRDEDDDLVTDGGYDIELSTTAGSLSEAADNGDGTYTATLTSSSTEETATITGTLESEDIDDTAEVNFQAEVLEPSPEFTQIEVNPDELPADGESQATITVTLFDENNELITEGGYCELVDINTTDGILGTMTDNDDGTCTLPITAADNPGMAEITGTIEGEDIDDTAEIEFTALPPSPEFTQISARPNNILADGSSTSEVTVTLYNQNNERVETGSFVVNLSSDAGALSEVTDNGDGTYTAILTSSTNEETATIRGTLEGEEIDDTAQVNFEAELLEPSPEHTVITVDPDELPADGESESTVTVTLRDENDEPITDGGYCDLVDVDATAGTLSDMVDKGDGTCTLTLTSDTEPGTAELTAEIEGEDVEDTAEVEFLPLQPSPDFTIITASPQKILANGASTSQITVILRDENNNPVTDGGFDVNLSTNAGSLSEVTDNGDGTYTATLTSSTHEEIATISGTLEGEDIIDTAEVEFTEEILPPSSEFTQITANPQSIKANGESTSAITVTLRDENNDLVGEGGYNVDLSTTAGTLGEITDNRDGTYTAVLTAGNMVATAVITGTVEGDMIDDNAVVEFVVEVLPPDPAFTEIRANPTQIDADGESTSTVTVILRNSENDPVGTGGFDVDLTTSMGTLSKVVDNNDGTYTATLTSSDIAGTAAISGTLDGAPIEDTAKVEFIMDIDESEPDTRFITVEAEPAEIPADGVSEAKVYVTLYDSAGERIEQSAEGTIELFTTNGTLEDLTDEGNGIYSTTLTASENPGEAVITATYNGEDVDDQAIVMFLSLDMFQCSVETVYPNPFLDNATFEVISPRAGRITLDLFDILGKRVARVVDTEVTAGEHEFAMNGAHLASGVYIYRYVCPCKCQSETGKITHMGRN